MNTTTHRRSRAGRAAVLMSIAVAFAMVLGVAAPAPSSASPTAQGLKVTARHDLAGLLPTGDGKVDKRIQKAVDEIDESLTADWWLTPDVLTDDDGKKVFDRERKAVDELGKVPSANAAAPVIETAVEHLVEADRLLAQTALDIAVANGGDAKRIGKAQGHMDAAAARLAADPRRSSKSDKDRFEAETKAIEDYRQAWDDATKAMQKRNRPPLAVADSHATDADVVLTVPAPGVLGNDADQDGDPISLTGADTASAEGATVSVALDGGFTYDPTGSASLRALPLGTTLEDTFTYGIADGQGGTATGVVTVVVTGVNTPPTADGQSVSTPEDTAITITLTGSDAEGDPLTFAIDSPPTHGVLGAVTSTGPTSATVDYTPDPDFNGADAFTFTADDGVATSGTATVDITVTPVNDAPTAADGSVSTPEDTAVTVEMVGADVDGDSLSFSIVSPPSNGNLGAIVPTGPTTAEVDYTPDPDFNGADSFTFRVNDGTTNSAAATASITISPVNDPPTFTPGPDVTVDDDAGPQSSAWATAISPGPADEAGQTVSFNVTNDAPGLFASAPAIDNSGNLTFTPATGSDGTANVQVTAQDDGGTADGGIDQSAPQSFTITVQTINHPPTAVSDGPYSAAPHIRVSVPASDGLLVNSYDDPSESGTTLHVDGSGTITTTNGGTITVNTSDGSFIYDPPAGFTGTDDFDYRVCDDGTGSPASACSPDTNVEITVGGPIIWFVDNSAGSPGDGRLTTPFDSLATFAANATDSAGDAIFLFESSGAPYTNGVVLLDQQKLLGQTVDLATETGITPPAGSDPLPATTSSRSLLGTTGDAIVLAADNTVRGIDISSSAGDGVSGSGVGTLVIDDAAITNAGATALSLNGGTPDITLDYLYSSSFVVPGVSLTGLGAGSAVTVDDGVSGVPDTVARAAGGGIVVSSSAGTFDFGHTEVQPGAAAAGDGIRLNGNPSGTFTFDTLVVTAPNGAGLVASGGTVHFTGDAPEIVASGGPAVDLDGVTFPSGATFGLLRSTNSGADGVRVTNLAGSFTVTGLTDIDNPSTQGIDLTSSSATFTFATVDIDATSPGGHGVDARDLSGSLTIASTGGGVTFDTASPDDQHGVFLDNVADASISGDSATCSPDGSNVAGCFTIRGPGAGGSALGTHGIASTASGDLTMDRVLVDNSGVLQSAGADHGVFIENPDADATVGIANSRFVESDEDAVHLAKTNAGAFTLNVTDSWFLGDIGDGRLDTAVHLDDWTNGHVVATFDGNTVWNVGTAAFLIRPAGTSGTAGTQNSITILDNVVTHSDNNGIAVDALDSSDTLVTIQGNTLTGDSGVGVADDEAIDLCICGTGTTATLDVKIGGSSATEANVISNWDDEGVRASSFGSDLAGTMNLRIENNGFDTINTRAVLVETDDSSTINAVLVDNTMAVTTAGFEWDPRSSTASTTRVYLEGNEAPEFHFDDQSNSDYILGCDTAQPTCSANNGSTITMSSGSATVASILSEAGNTTSGGGPLVSSDVGGPSVTIVDRNTILSLVP